MRDLAGRSPLDFRFLDIMIVLLVLTGGVSILVVFSQAVSRKELRILSTTLPDALVGRPYKLKLIASGGQEPYVWSAPGLPDGMKVRADGTMIGSPTRAGTYQVSLTVADQGPNPATEELPIIVVKTGSSHPFAISTRALPLAYYGRSLEVTLAAEGGVAPYSWSIENLPEGLEVEGPFLSGKPENSGVFEIAVVARDSAGNVDEEKFDLQVVADLPESLSTEGGLVVSSLVPPMISGRSYEVQLCAFGGQPPYQWKPLSFAPGVTCSGTGLLRVEEPGSISDGWSMQVKVYDASGQSVVGAVYPRIIQRFGTGWSWAFGIAAVTCWIVVFLLLRLCLANGWQRQVEMANFTRAVGGCILLGLVATSTQWVLGVVLFIVATIIIAVFLLVRAGQ